MTTVTDRSALTSAIRRAIDATIREHGQELWLGEGYAADVTLMGQLVEALSSSAASNGDLEQLLDRLEHNYDFASIGGPLKTCAEWLALKALMMSGSARAEQLKQAFEAGMSWTLSWDRPFKQESADQGFALFLRRPGVLFSVSSETPAVIWSMEQVAMLNRAQLSAMTHPYTCPNRGNHPEFWGDAGVLVATVRGWICPCCDYTQNWAHGVPPTPGPSPADVMAAIEQQEKWRAERRAAPPRKTPIDDVNDGRCTAYQWCRLDYGHEGRHDYPSSGPAASSETPRGPCIPMCRLASSTHEDAEGVERCDLCGHPAEQAAASSETQEERPSSVAVELQSAKFLLMHLEKVQDHACGRCVPGGEIVQANFTCIRHRLLDFVEAQSEPCDACPFRVDGINTTPENAAALIERAMDPWPGEDDFHPCHKTVLTGERRPCRGAVLFAANVTHEAGHDGIFTSRAAMLEAKTLGVDPPTPKCEKPEVQESGVGKSLIE